MGAAVPAPGLYSKFFDVDMDPLVEVVRDTVGRHDMFALACQPKYYEDLGYPGPHQLHGELQRPGRRATASPSARAGRRSTSSTTPRFDCDNLLIADEPWSRPGDYVLLRAMTDLVCASSACPDDIDPANGWEITDVHVRVYSPDNTFSRAIAHRVTPEAEPVLTKETAFHPRTSELTESFVEYRGYWLPHCFNNEGGDRRVLGLPREGRRDGPVAAAQVGGARPRRRGARAARGHARHPPARGRPGGLHGGLQRDRRDDRRRHRLPARPGQLPLRRRRRVRRRLAARAGRAARASRCGSSPRPTSCTTSPSRARAAARS